jgi:hypothetical protein
VVAEQAIEPGLDPASPRSPARARRVDEERPVPSPDVLRVADPATASSVIDRLQRTAGNRAVQRAVSLVVSRDDDVTRSSISETTDTGNKYTQELVLNKTKATIKVQLGINWVKSGTWGSDDDFKKFVRAVKPITYAHEFGHAALGASDEYANPAMPDRVLTNDHSIMANYYQQGIPQAEFKARHFQHIVTEVAKAFAGYTCSLRPM